MPDLDRWVNKVTCMDCLEGMKQLPDGCVDLVVTDPPYGYSFMGKDWDKAVPKVEVWRECLRVLKPGAFAFVMCTPRQDCLARMIVNLQDAGFRTDFTSIYWAYASGFPKAQNIGKIMDKRNGRNEELRKQFAQYIKQTIKDSQFTLKDIRIKLQHKMKGGGLIPHWITEKSQPTVPVMEDWRKLKEILGLDNSWDWFIEREEAEREVVGKKATGDPVNWYANQDTKPRDGLVDITIPATSQAQAFNGSYAGFQPKPAVEVILVAMKPLSEKTFVDQALKNGKGISWLDEGRIPYESEDDKIGNQRNMKAGTNFNGNEKNNKYLQPHFKGRFPANLLVSDDVLNDGRMRKVGGDGKKRDTKDKQTTFGGGLHNGNSYGDNGSFSRYFSLDSWFAEKLKQLPESVQKTFPFLIVPKASKTEKNRGCENLPTKIGGCSPRSIYGIVDNGGGLQNAGQGFCGL